MRLLYSILLVCIIFSAEMHGQNSVSARKNINDLLDRWHKAAAKADEDAYFSFMDEKSIFIGTDADENWDLDAFRAYAKPHFDKGKAWSFSVLERNIFLEDSVNIAWFDELLETQMGICRGSGVVVYNTGNWKIKHYVLSITVPNENVEELTALKKDHDQELQKKLKN